MSASAANRALEGRRSAFAARVRNLGRLDTTAMLTLTVVALGVRVPAMSQSFGGDEIHTYGVVHGRDLGSMLHELRTGGEVSPPLYFLLAWAGAKASDPTLWMRMPSLVFSTAAVPLTYLLGCRTVGRSAAAVGAVLLALSPSALAYAREARPYAMLMFLVVLSSLLLLDAVRSQRRGAWALYALSGIAILYTHYFGILAIALQAGWALWAVWPRWRSVVVTCCVIVLSLVPLAPTIADQRPNHADILSYVDLTADWIARQSTKVLPGHPGFPGKEIPGTAAQAAFLVVLGIATLLALVRVGRRRAFRGLRPDPRALPFVLALGTILGLILLSFAGDNVYQVKYLVGTLPAFVLVVGTLVTAMPRQLAWIGGAVVLAVAATGCVKSFDSRYRNPPFRQAASFIVSRANPGDAVIDSSGFSIGPRLRQYSRPLEIYLDGRKHRLLVTTDAKRVFADPPSGQVFVAAGLTGSRVLALPRPAVRDGLCQIDRRVFAGSTPVVVYDYAGPAPETASAPSPQKLVREDGHEAIELSPGRRIPIAPGVATGYLERVQTPGRRLKVIGWSVGPARHRRVGCIIVFRDGRPFASGMPAFVRQDVAKTYGASAAVAGFVFERTVDLGGTDPAAGLRVFAVVDGRASELKALPDLSR